MINFIGIIKSLPAIIAFLLELKKLWDENIARKERKEKMVQLKEKIKAARKSKDSSELESFIRNIVNR